MEARVSYEKSVAHKDNKHLKLSTRSYSSEIHIVKIQHNTMLYVEE